MANTTDNKNCGFDSGGFREDLVEPTSGTVSPTMKMVNTIGTSLSQDPFHLDIEKIFKSVTGELAFDSLIDSSSKKALYDMIYGMVSDDLSFKGTGLSNKAEIKDFFMKECIDIGDGLREQFGVTLDLKGYSLLAMLLALACNGVNNLISQVLDTMGEYVDVDALKSIVPRLLDLHSGHDGIELLKDLSISEIGPSIGSMFGNGVESFVNFYNKDDNTNRTGAVDKMSDVLDISFSGWSSGDSISNLNHGLFKTDVRNHTLSKSPVVNVTTTVTESLDSFDLMSLF